MRIQKTYYNAIVYDNNLTDKARDDRFDPTTEPRKDYKTWRAVLDLKICLDCAEKHGRIFDISDSTVRLPPLHINCRCTLEEMEAIKAGGATKDGTNGSDYWLKHFGELPDYYVSPEQLEALGWHKGDRPSKYAAGKMLGGGVYNNDDRKLPHKSGRTWREADINYTPGRRNMHRILWSNDGLVFATYDHYHTFYEII